MKQRRIKRRIKIYINILDNRENKLIEYSLSVWVY